MHEAHLNQELKEVGEKLTKHIDGYVNAVVINSDENSVRIR